MSNELNRVTKRLFQEEVKLESHVVELGVTDQISTMAKDLQKQVAAAWKADAQIKAAVDKLNSAWKFWSMNSKMPNAKAKILEGYAKQLEKLSNELGIDLKTLPAYKEVSDGFQAISELEDAIGNMQEHLKTIGK